MPTASAEHPFAKAERQLREAFTGGEKFVVAFAGRGDGAIPIGGGDIHWVPSDNSIQPNLETHVLLVEGSQTKAEAAFDRTNGCVDLRSLFIARCVDEIGDERLYRVEQREAGRLVRTITAAVSPTQQAEAKPTDVHKVEGWCKLKSEEIPPDGGTVRIDLNEVRIEPSEKPS